MRQRDRLKKHVWIEVGDGKQCRMWLDLWLQGGPILKRVGEWVLFNAVSRYKARLLGFISSDGEWSWMRVSIELIDLWDKVHVTPSSKLPASIA